MSVLGKKFGFFSLIRFALPSMLMMMVTSLYTIVDSIFVSRFVNTNALSAINIAYPIINVIIAVGIMLAAGGCAIIAHEMGEGKNEDASRHFTLIVIAGVVGGVIISLLGLIFVEPLLRLMGATEVLYSYCEQYLVIQLLFTPFCVLQLIFQSFFVTAGRPTLGMVVSIVAGLVNAALDYILIVPMQLGIAGAAIGTGIGFTIPCIVGMIFFLRGSTTLKLVKPRFEIKVLLKACLNGSSEMVGNLATGVTTLLFNLMMLRFAGEDGVAAITIVLYAQFLLIAIIMGYSIGVSPVVSYNYGAKNEKRLKSVCRINLIFTSIVSVIVFVIAQIFAPLIVVVFTPEGSNVYNLALNGIQLFAYSFLFAGLNIMASALFTSLSNGKVSAIISFLRTFLFTASLTIILPMVWGINGVWFSTVAAEILALVVSFIYVIRYNKKYHYM